MTQTRLFTLGREERLKSRKLINQLFREGKNFHIFPFKVFYVCAEKIFNTPASTFNVQFGVGVSSRNFKKAVDRNRIKRLSREAYRIQKVELYELLQKTNRQLAVFMIYTGRELPDYKILAEKIALTLQRLMKELQ